METVSRYSSTQAPSLAAADRIVGLRPEVWRGIGIGFLLLRLPVFSIFAGLLRLGLALLKPAALLYIAYRVMKRE